MAGRMGRPRSGVSDVATTRRILEAAEAEFARRGYEAARLEDVAQGAGIRRSSLLYHFESKAELYAAVIRGVFSALGEALAVAGAEPAAFSDQFDAMVRGLSQFLEERTWVAPLMLRELLDDRGAGHALLLEAGIPVLLRIERFVREGGRGLVRPDIPVRQALLMIFSSALVRAAAGPLREPLWGKADRGRQLARMLFLEE